MTTKLLADAAQFNELVGASSLADVMDSIDQQAATGKVGQVRASPTGFTPLDDVLNGGLRPGDLCVLGGPSGVGKTILALQMARNVAFEDPTAHVMYICYEHDRAHLLMRLLCMESAALDHGDSALNLRRLQTMIANGGHKGGFTEQLRASPSYARVVKNVETYADRLHLVKASGTMTTLDQIRLWVRRLVAGSHNAFLIIDYLQKIPVEVHAQVQESEVTTYLAQGLKELAMTAGIRILVIAAADRMGLQSKRMRLYDMRGSSAIQYEADIGLVVNNKFMIVSREHIVYNPVQAETMRNWIVVSAEKNRSGRNGVDMEFHLDAPHFRVDPEGDFVHDRLIDDRLTRE